MTTKPSPPVTVRLEHANGVAFQLRPWLSNVMKDQDIEAWKRESAAEGKDWKVCVQAWIKGQLTCAIENLDVLIKESKLTPPSQTH